MTTIYPLIRHTTVLVCCLLLVACDKIPDIPIGLGYTAKNVCSGLYVSGLDQDHLLDDLIAPQVQPLPLLWDISVDDQTRTVHARDKLFGDLFAKTAYYREGYGCTLLQDATPSELAAQVTPREPVLLPPEQSWPFGNDVRLGAEANLLAPALDAVFAENDEQQRNTKAVAIVHQGQLVAERYAPGVDETTRLTGWSMTKSVTSTWIGMLADRGWLSLDGPAPVAEWQGTDKVTISITHLLHMAAGLDWHENAQGKDPDQGHVLHLEPDFAAYFAARPSVAEPGSTFNYTTGGSSLLARIAQMTVGGTLTDSDRFLRDNLFAPLGISSAVLEYDTVGQPGGGSYLWLTARDWARLGLLYLQRGDWFGERVLSEQWIDFALTPSPANPRYGAQIWLNTDNAIWPSLPANTFAFRGHQAQSVVVVPDYDLVVVRLGFTFGGDDGLETLVASVIDTLSP